MKLDDFDFPLPEDLIATRPARPRSSARKLRRIAALARPVVTMSIQLACGRWPSAVMISTLCPFLRRVQRGTRMPSTLAETQELPMRVWMA